MGSSTAIKRKLYSPEEYDNDSVFLRMVEEHVRPGSCVLDLGAGAGQRWSHGLKSRTKPAGTVVGADFDPSVTRNPLLDEAIVLQGSGLPFADNSFDVVFTRYVMEHVTSPAEFLSEIHRVLVPGGMFLFLTPNKWHYVCMAARCTPAWFHRVYNRWRGRAESDTFPTVYQLNSRSAIRRHFDEAGLLERELAMRECCPNYLTLWAPLFLLGVVYERLVNATGLFAFVRGNILGCFAKPGKGSTGSTEGSTRAKSPLPGAGRTSSHQVNP